MDGMATTLARLGRTPSNPRYLADKVMENPRLLQALTRGLEADSPRFKYGCAKALRMVSEERPELLYPRFDFFLRQFDHGNKILQWEAAFVLSHLAHVDIGDKFTAAFEKYFSPITGPAMITAANVIKGGVRIAQAKPHLADRIAAEVLK